MKRFSLLTLVAFFFAAGCTDSTAPANSGVAQVSRGPVSFGDPPPPPVDAAITFTISSTVHLVGAFEGVYFSQGKTAWLRLNNSQSDLFQTSSSANARFQNSDGRLSGHGTITIDGQVVTIDEVTFFRANPDCGVTGGSCAFIRFNATIGGDSNHTGTAEVFNRAACTIIPPSEGFPGFFDCPRPG